MIFKRLIEYAESRKLSREYNKAMERVKRLNLTSPCNGITLQSLYEAEAAQQANLEIDITSGAQYLGVAETYWDERGYIGIRPVGDSTDEAPNGLPFIAPEANDSADATVTVMLTRITHPPEWFKG